MISFHDPRSRRDFLRVGSLSLGGLSLSHLFAKGDAPISAGKSKPITDKAVIFLFLHGGPSQLETFDPKMTAPVEIRSATGEVATSLPGVTFGGTFPKIAAMANRLAVVRSYVPGDAGHNIKPVVSPYSSDAGLGAAYASIAGGNHPTTGMPTNIMLFPRAVRPESQPGQMKFGNFLATGPFGPTTTPFQPGGGGDLQSDMKLSFPTERLEDRRSLLRSIDGVKTALDEGLLAHDETREKAMSLLAGGIGDAFDLSGEDPKTVARYDTAPLVRPETINKKWNNHKLYVDDSQTLGKLLLLARRLVERGAGFVTVTTNFVWDMHADANNATMTEGMSYMAPSLDHALPVFLEDLRQRGLEDKVLVVCCGEIGRTPKINKNGGRDHWGNIGPLILAGGGLNMGQVIGQSDRQAGTPATEPVRIPNLISTIMHTLFDAGRLRVSREASRELLALIEPKTIPGLM